MLITRCPNCETTFRVRMEQLNLRAGRVRCGHCQVPFSALSTLEELPEDMANAVIAATTPKAPTPVPQPVAAYQPPNATEPIRQVVEAPAVAAPAIDAFGPIDLPPTAPVLAKPNGEATDHHGLAAARFATHGSAPFAQDDDIELDFDTDFEPLETSESPKPASPVIAHTEPEFIELGKAIDDAEAEEFDREFEQSLAASEAAGEHFIDEAESNEHDDMPQLHTVFLDDDVPHGIGGDAALRVTQKKTRRTLWLANVLLLLTGLLLASYVLRVEITRHFPAMRPHLEQLCQLLSCDVPFPRDADEVVLVGSDLTQASTPKGSYHLAVTVRNHAVYPVAWPQLEVTLTDRFERALTRRVLEPTEWLPASIVAKPAFEAEGEITSQITLSSDAQVVGYRLGVFYR